MMLVGNEICQAMRLPLKISRETSRLKRRFVYRDVRQVQKRARKLRGLRAFRQEQKLELQRPFIGLSAQRGRKHYFLMALLQMLDREQGDDAEQREEKDNS